MGVVIITIFLSLYNLLFFCVGYFKISSALHITYRRVASSEQLEKIEKEAIVVLLKHCPRICLEVPVETT